MSEAPHRDASVNSIAAPREDYGQDAPTVVRNPALIGVALILIDLALNVVRAAMPALMRRGSGRSARPTCG